VSSGQVAWAEAFYPVDMSSDTFLTGLAADEAGDLYVGGSFDSSIVIGAANLTLASGDSTDMWLARLDPKGKPLWAKTFAGATGIGGVAYDGGTHHVIAAGSTRKVTDFGAPSGPVQAGVFVATFNKSGSVVWANGCAQSGAGASTGPVAVDSNGNVTVTGTFAGSLTCGSNVLTSSSPSTFSIFAVQFDALGQQRWALEWGDRSSGTKQNEYVYGIAAAPDGSVWLTGQLNGLGKLTDGSLITTAGNGDFLMLKVDSSGHVVRGGGYGDGAAQQGQAVAVDAKGNVYASGQSSGSIDFGDGPHHAIGQQDVVLAAFDSEGAVLWSQDFGGADGDNFGPAVAVEPSGDILLGAGVNRAIDLGDGTFLSNAASYVAIARFKPPAMPAQAPSLVGVRYLGGQKSAGNARVEMFAVALGPVFQGPTKTSWQDVFFGGYFKTPTDLGTGTLPEMSTSLYGGTAFAVRMAP
jgi:hypothetical protein